MHFISPSIFIILFFGLQTTIFAQSLPDTYVGDTQVWTDATNCNTARNINWLTAREQKMILEINMVRTNPQRYLAYVEQYYNIVKRVPKKPVAGVNIRYTYDSWGNPKEISRDTVWGASVHVRQDDELISSIEDLLGYLKTATPVQPLKVSACLTEAARDQGLFCREQRRLTHDGRNNKEFDTRMQTYCGEMAYGGETIAGGAISVRQTVLNWLIDAGLNSRNHRKILLDANTTKVGLFYVGTVGGMRYSWVANFAR